MNTTEERAWLIKKMFPEKAPNATLNTIEQGRLILERNKQRANSKDPTKATTKENSPPAKDAGGRSRTPGSEGYKPQSLADQKISPSYNSTKATTKDTTKATTKATTKDNTKKSPTSFGKSFADARRAGEKTFMWNGKSYTTKRADDKPKASIKSQDARPTKSNAQRPDFTPQPVDKKVETRKSDPKKVTRNSSTIDKIKDVMGFGRKRTAKEDMGYELQNKARASMGMKKGGAVKSRSRSINGIAVRGLTRAKHK